MTSLLAWRAAGRLRPARVPVAVRAVLLVAGVVLAVVPEHRTATSVTATLLATALTLLAPRAVGSTVLSAVFVLSWTASGGWHEVPSIPRTVLAAAALYLVHSSAALAACLPLDAAVSGQVLSRWVVRALPPLAVAAVVIAVDEVLPQQGGAAVVELLGLAGVVLIGVAVACAVLRRDPSSIE